MKKLTNKHGIALILTISVLMALTILGIAFVSLLHRDKKNQDINTDILFAGKAMDAAINIGIDEIKSQLIIDKHYFYSEIESADPALTGVPDSSLYFKTIISATNAKLSLYQSSCEVYNVFPYLIDEMTNLSTLLKTDAKNIYKTIAVYQTSWDMKFISDFMKVKKSGIAEKTNAEIYNNIVDYITINPKGKDGRIANIIDYGVCDAAVTPTTFTAKLRDFAPTGKLDSLRGAFIEIIAGTGYDPVNRNIRIIDKAQSAHSNVLILKGDSWPNGVNPIKDGSVYRIYSYVVPINFNAASKELIKAQFECIDPAVRFITNNYGNEFIGAYAPKSPAYDTFMSRLYDLRENDPSLSCSDKIINNLAVFKDDYLGKIFNFNLVQRKEKLWRQFDPTQPKGIYDSTSSKWLIFPPAVPFCFENNGYYDMEIEAGFKRNPKFKKAKHIEKRYVTVKIGGLKDYNLREDFTSDKGEQHWVSTSDWVPVNCMKNISNWGTVYMSGFQPYIKDITANSENVFPDSIKNGIWLDFGAELDKRGSDLIYSEISKKLEEVKNIDSTNFFTKIKGQNPVISGGQLKIKGVTAGSTSPYTPESEIIYGTNGVDADKYEFGEVSVLAKIEEDTGSIQNIKMLQQEKKAILLKDFLLQHFLSEKIILDQLILEQNRNLIHLLFYRILVLVIQLENILQIGCFQLEYQVII